MGSPKLLTAYEMNRAPRLCHLFWGGVPLAPAPAVPVLLLRRGVSGLVGKDNVCPGHLFLAKLPTASRCWWFWVVGGTDVRSRGGTSQLGLFCFCPPGGQKALGFPAFSILGNCRPHPIVRTRNQGVVLEWWVCAAHTHVLCWGVCSCVPALHSRSCDPGPSKLSIAHISRTASLWVTASLLLCSCPSE